MKATFRKVIFTGFTELDMIYMMMRKSLTLLLVAGFLLLSSSCQRRGRLRIVPITHLAVGASTTLLAYEEVLPSRSGASAQAAPVASAANRVAAAWSVSDPTVASVKPDGTVEGIKEGRTTVTATWEGQEIAANVHVVRSLRAGWLPQLSTEGMSSSIGEVKLSLSTDRTLRFRMDLGESTPAVTLEAKAPDEQLPWAFNFEQGSLLLTRASGRLVSGELRLKAGGRTEFTVWSDDSGVYPVSLKDKTVLMLGDSMAEGLSWFLRGKVEAAGGRYILEVKYSSTIPNWESGKLKESIERHKPDILFISLGSNELFILKPEQTRAPLIQQMRKDIGDLTAFWIGPPSWKPDKGLVRVIEENFQPDHFYNSNDLKVDRRRDGAHPTREGFEIWANLVWDWYAGIG